MAHIDLNNISPEMRFSLAYLNDIVERNTVTVAIDESLDRGQKTDKKKYQKRKKHGS